MNLIEAKQDLTSAMNAYARYPGGSYSIDGAKPVQLKAAQALIDEGKFEGMVDAEGKVLKLVRPGYVTPKKVAPPGTVLMRRDQLKPGMVVLSSGGYKLLLTNVVDDAPNRSDERSVFILGYLHADPKNELRSEVYPVTCLIPVEVPKTVKRTVQLVKSIEVEPTPGMNEPKLLTVYMCEFPATLTLGEAIIWCAKFAKQNKANEFRLNYTLDDE